MGAGEEEILQHAGPVARGIDEPFAQRAEVEGAGIAGGAQVRREGGDLGFIRPDAGRGKGHQ